jgi:hypothetical protein
LADNIKKFLFDTNDFGEDALRKKKAAAKTPVFSQAEMEASRQTGLEEGKIIGINETLNSQESHIRDILQQVVMAATRLEDNETQRLATFIDQATLISAQALTKIIPTLLNMLTVAQIDSFIRKVLAEQIRAQSLNIYIASEHKDAIETRLKQILQNMRRKINCEVHADSTLSNLQCRFEWTGGGAQWDPDHLSTTILNNIIAQMPDDIRQHMESSSETLDETIQTPHNESNSSGDAP